MSGSGMESRKYNRGAEFFFDEAEEARASTMISNLNYGKYSCNIILHHEDESEVKRRCEIVITTLEEMGFKTRNETINSEEAFLSTIDGNIYKNVDGNPQTLHRHLARQAKPLLRFALPF